jgi:hypothetical protein
MINSFSPQEFAAGYELDILEEQAVLFEGELTAESLQAELTAVEFAVTLAYGVPTVPLPANLKGKLFSDLGVSEVDRLPSYIDSKVNYPKPPLLNRPSEEDIRGVRVGIQPRRDE